METLRLGTIFWLQVAVCMVMLIIDIEKKFTAVCSISSTQKKETSQRTVCQYAPRKKSARAQQGAHVLEHHAWRSFMTIYGTPGIHNLSFVCCWYPMQLRIVYFCFPLPAHKNRKRNSSQQGGIDANVSAQSISNTRYPLISCYHWPTGCSKHQIYVQSHYVLVIGGNEARPQYLQ